jgi:HEAT repeat protein
VALIAALSDPERQVRLNAALSLAAIDPKQAQPALPVLIAFLAENDAQFRSRAVETLRRLGPVAESAGPSLLPLLKEQSFERRFEAAEALIAVSPAQAEPAVPILAEALKPSPQTGRALYLASRLGKTAQGLVPILLPLLKLEDVNRRLAAAEALVHIDPAQAQAAVPVITALFKDERAAKLDILGALERLGPRAQAATPALLALLEDPKFGDGPEAAVVLVKLDSTQTDMALRFLREGLKAKPSRFGSLRALEQFGAAAKSGSPPCLS